MIIHGYSLLLFGLLGTIVLAVIVNDKIFDGKITLFADDVLDPACIVRSDFGTDAEFA